MILKKITRIAFGGLLIAGVLTTASCGNKDVKSSDDYKKQVATEGTIVIGLDDTFAPMGFRDEKGDLVGFDIDLAKKVGEELGLKVEFKPISWEAKELELKSKNIDAIWNGMSVTPERKENMALSNKYLDNTIILMKLKEDGDVEIKQEADLKKYKIATQADSAALETMKRSDKFDEFKENITEYPDYDKAILALKSKRVDAIAIDQVLGEYKNKNLGEALETCEYKLGDDAYAIGFRKGDIALKDAVNKALEKLVKDKVGEEISNKWFGKNIMIFRGLD